MLLKDPPPSAALRGCEPPSRLLRTLATSFGVTCQEVHEAPRRVGLAMAASRAKSTGAPASRDDPIVLTCGGTAASGVSDLRLGLAKRFTMDCRSKPIRFARSSICAFCTNASPYGIWLNEIVDGSGSVLILRGDANLFTICSKRSGVISALLALVSWEDFDLGVGKGGKSSGTRGRLGRANSSVRFRS